MKATTATATSPIIKKKKDGKAAAIEALAMCPVGGAGWCPYPFSPEQLARRMKEREKDLLSKAKTSAR